MKTILYVGATLMIGASIYGFVDYKKASRSKEFTKMYDPKETTEPVSTNDKTKEVVIKPEIKNNEKSIILRKKPVKNNKVVEEKVTAKLPMKPMETIIAEKAANNTVLKENAAIETDKSTGKKKVLSYRLFSRAPLEEKYISKELKLEPAKEEPKKTENKEQ